MNLFLISKDGAERVSEGGPSAEGAPDLAETSAPQEPGLSAIDCVGAQCEGEDLVGAGAARNRRPPSLRESEIPTGNTLVEMVRAGTIECAECGCRAQMRCQCGILICLNHVYDIDGDPRCGKCVTDILEERHIADDLTVERYRNAARRR